MSITERREESKGVLSRIPADLLVILVLLLACTAAFGLGILVGKEMGKGRDDDRLWIEQLSKAEPALPAAAAQAPIYIIETEADVPKEAGKYVASKTGSKYHLTTCSGAKRIKEENKVWFMTKEEAEQAGYEPAANCPGL